LRIGSSASCGIVQEAALDAVPLNDPAVDRNQFVFRASEFILEDPIDASSRVSDCLRCFTNAGGWIVG